MFLINEIFKGCPYIKTPCAAGKDSNLGYARRRKDEQFLIELVCSHWHRRDGLHHLIFLPAKGGIFVHFRFLAYSPAPAVPNLQVLTQYCLTLVFKCELRNSILDHLGCGLLQWPLTLGLYYISPR